MSNVTPIMPPYFDNLRELIRHAENMGMRELYEQDELPGETITSTRLYEREALENFIGEAQCVIQEATKRIRYLETVLAEDL